MFSIGGNLLDADKIFETIFLWVSITPFGIPVVPDVYIMVAKSSGKTFFILKFSSLSIDLLSFSNNRFQFGQFSNSSNE